MKIFACVFTVVAVLSFSCAHAKDLPLAPDFKLSDLNKNTYVLSENRKGSNVLLLFWTTWCPYCRDELRELNNLSPGLVEAGVQVLAIDVGERFREVENFVKNFKPSYTVLLDTDTSVAKSYGVLGVPTYIIIDKAGKIVFTDNYFPESKYKELISK